MNMVLRQSTHMAAGLAQFIANRYSAGVKDDGDLNKIEAGLAAVIAEMIASASPDLSGITSHIGNKSNPHAVTKSQIGLGNLPNAKSDSVSSNSSSQLATSKAVKTAYDKAAAGFDGKLTRISTRSSTGTWTLTGLTPGRLVHLGFSGTLAYLNVTGGSLDKRANDGIFSAIGATNGNNGYALSGAIRPDLPTVTIQIVTIDGTLRAYQ